MNVVIENTVLVGVDTILFSGAGSILVSLGTLVNELHGSRTMCEELIKSVSELQQPLKQMLARDNISVTRQYIELYKSMLVNIQSCLQDHVNSNLITRLARHWTMKDRIKDFYVERDRIAELIQLAFIDEVSTNHSQLSGMIEQVVERNHRIDIQHQQWLIELKHQIAEIPQSTVNQLESNTIVALADLKNLIKVNGFDYEENELEMMKTLFVAGCKKYQIPRESLSLPIWYISRSDVRFELSNPFATGDFLSFYIGTLSSGARVAVNIVNAEPNDEVVRDQFIKEVNTLNALRDPHVLPFFGANHIGSPLMYVTAYAELGDFCSFLKVHRHKYWQLFLDAARGLAYLHKNKLVHGNLKCANLLVMKDGTGVVSDFRFAFVRASSALSKKTKPPASDWTAPECLGVGENANPRFESDTYALGMCLIEGATGERPFNGIADSDDHTRELIRNGELPYWEQVPQEVAQLARKMCAIEYTNRPKLSEVIRILEVLAAREQIPRDMMKCVCENVHCHQCGMPTHTQKTGVYP